MPIRKLRMTDDLWNSIPPQNRSKWIREAIREKKTREILGEEKDYMGALMNSTEQLRRVGVNLSQVLRLLHSEKTDTNALPIRELSKAIRIIMYDTQELKQKYKDG